MVTTETDSRIVGGLRHSSSSVRLQAALAAGTSPDPRLVGPLLERCADEPDFFVRDMLTWALTRHPPSGTVPLLIRELRSARPQARSQALHTLSKIRDRQAWPAITPELLTDADDEVARAAWRTAVVLVPPGEGAALAETLISQLGRGERETQLSLSRALIDLGDVMLPALRAAAGSGSAPASSGAPTVGSESGALSPGSLPPGSSAASAGASSAPSGSSSAASSSSSAAAGSSSASAGRDSAGRWHAIATEQLFHDPEAGFEWAIEQAKRIVALGPDAGEGTRVDERGE